MGVSELVKIEPKFLDAISICGLPKLKKGEPGFQSLFKIIVGQQLSTIAANSIWKRLLENDLTQVNSILSVKDERLRSLGLSRTKISYVKGLALANIDYDALVQKSDNDIIQELITVKGIGLWTAQIYLMFSLKRADIFASGDLALKEGVRMLFKMQERPSSEKLSLVSEPWKPFRTVAAMIIWNFYGLQKVVRSN